MSQSFLSWNAKTERGKKSDKWLFRGVDLKGKLIQFHGIGNNKFANYVYIISTHSHITWQMAMVPKCTKFVEPHKQTIEEEKPFNLPVDGT